MLRLEEYILKRKKEDGINELDFNKRQENTQICVNYIFEYFNNYLESSAVDSATLQQQEKINKYLPTIINYSPEIQSWLIDLYSSYGNMVNRILRNMIDDTYFLLYNTEAEFRALSYAIFPKAVKRLSYLQSYSEQIFTFIKEDWRVQNLPQPYVDENPTNCEPIDEWIHSTYSKHGVNLYNFCQDWASIFFENSDMWPKSHRIKGKYYDEYKGTKYEYTAYGVWEYDYKKPGDLFGLDSLYRKMPKKPFTKARKQFFEALLMHCWTHHIEEDRQYWEEYIEKVAPTL